MMPPEQEPLPVRSAKADGSILGRVERFIHLLNRILLWIAGVGLVGMLLLIVGDVIGIKVLHRPIPGGIELVAFFAVVAIAFALGFTQIMRGHVAVDFIVESFPRRAKLIIDVFMMLFSACLFALMAWYSFKYAGQLHKTGEVSMTQKIPFYPFVYGGGAGGVITFLVLVTELVKAGTKAVSQWTR